MRTSWVLVVVLGALAIGCGAAVAAPRPPPDRPVPVSEPRAELAARVDLARARDCEEAFDLAMYRNRAIDLIEWDHDTGTCEDRSLRVRYLSGAIDEDQVAAEMRKHAVRVRVSKGK